MKVLKLSVMTVLLISNQSGFSQNVGSMLITEISGNKYEKRSYDKRGLFKSYQMFHLGDLESKGDYFEIPMKTYSFNRDKQLTDSAETTLRCDFKNSSLYLSIFPFAEKAVNKTVILRSKGSHLIYPQNPYPSKDLETVEFVMAIDGGVLDLFGSRTKIKLFDRKASADSEDETRYLVSSIMSVKSYLIGVRILATTYRVEELINISKGILKQKFIETNGSYFTIELM